VKRRIRQFIKEISILKQSIKDYLKSRVSEEELYEDFRRLFPPEPYFSPP
jgi:hypothetical protein